MSNSDYEFSAARESDFASTDWMNPNFSTTARFDYQASGSQTQGLLVIGDNVPGDTSSTVTLTVGGAHVIGTLETIGDQDFYRITLTKGQVYELGMYMKTGGPSGVPVGDALLELYNQNGELITSADGGGPNTPSGLDALLSYQAEYTGTYYLNARAFDNAPVDGDKGDMVGDYEVFVRGQAPGGYNPHYTADSPLYSIDWGTQIDHTSRNPDGDNGPRDNGSPATGVGWNQFGITGKNVITYYLAKQGDIFIDEDPTTAGTTDTMVAKGWSSWEHDALKIAFKAYESVADLIYVEVQSRTEADFIFITYNGTPGPGASLLGRMSPPNEENEGRGEFNAGDERWNEAGLAPGGFTFTTLIHEMGHGHGLAHPHDNGGHSGIMNGVEASPLTVQGNELPVPGAFAYTNGDYDLNQSVYTMMSYEDGWEKSPYGQAATQDPYGWLGGLMAFDIAAIQDKYGVNENWATGNDTYELKDVNAPGTMYTSIWDAGGTDTLKYSGARDANLDLRAATLKYEVGGGGFISHAWGVFGGFTIANGVTIENAITGSGNDTLMGNLADNVLQAGAGNDKLTGGGGNDQLRGGTGDDSLDGGDGVDSADYLDAMGGVTVDLRLEGVAQVTGGGGTDILTSIEQLFGSNYADTLYAGDGKGWISGRAGNDWLYGSDGNDALSGGAGSDHLEGGAGIDTAMYQYDAAAGVTINLVTGVHTGDAAGDTFDSIERFQLTSFGDKFVGSVSGEIVFGFAGNDSLDGGGGSDQLVGGAGDDVLTGGGGDDQFIFNAGFGRDRVADFTHGLDHINLSGIVGVDDYGDLRVTSSGFDTVITFGDGSNTITLTGVAAVTVTTADFLFT